MRRVWSRIAAARQEYGSAGLCWLILARALHTLSAGRARIVPYIIVAQPIRPATAAMRPDPASHTGLIGADDPITASFPREAHIVQQRFADGARCFVTRHKGEFAGHIWLSSGRHDEDEVRCTYVLPTDPLSVWDFDVFVAERFRHGRTMARMWAAVNESLAREGVAWTFSRISMFNPASLASHRRLGATATQTVVFVVAGRWQWMMGGGLHFSSRTDQRATLRLRPPSLAAATSNRNSSKPT
jgi:hypothetical protein